MIKEEERQLIHEILLELHKGVYFCYRVVEDMYDSKDARLLNLRDSAEKNAEMLEKLRNIT